MDKFGILWLELKPIDIVLRPVCPVIEKPMLRRQQISLHFQQYAAGVCAKSASVTSSGELRAKLRMHA